MNVTKLAPLVLICMLTLAMFSSVGVTASFNLVQWITQTFHGDVLKALGISQIWATINQLMADPIDDPKPN